jgi:hypothetical protein
MEKGKPLQQMLLGEMDICLLKKLNSPKNQ